MKKQRERIIVTGADGFLGKHLVNELHARNFNVVKATYENDLLFRGGIDELVRERPTDVVFHLAGVNGGIAFQKNCGMIFYENTMMALNVLECCRKWRVGKVVSIVASCAYPEYELVDEYEYPDGGHLEPREIMREDDFFDGPPHRTVEAHAYAKRNLQLISKFYREQYGLNAICVCPTTLFGPGDSTDPERTKVLMAVVKKVVDAHRNKEPSVTFWGSGSPYREFLYVKDAVKLIVDSAWYYDESHIPLNLGTGQEFTIKELVEKVVAKVGYSGSIHWDTTKPDGHHRKRLDLSRMDKTLPSFIPTPFDDALQHTIDWYVNEPISEPI